MNFTTESLQELDSKLNLLHDRILDRAVKLAKKQKKKVVDNLVMTQAYMEELK